MWSWLIVLHMLLCLECEVATGRPLMFWNVIFIFLFLLVCWSVLYQYQYLHYHDLLNVHMPQCSPWISMGVPGSHPWHWVASWWLSSFQAARWARTSFVMWGCFLQLLKWATRQSKLGFISLGCGQGWLHQVLPHLCCGCGFRCRFGDWSWLSAFGLKRWK